MATDEASSGWDPRFVPIDPKPLERIEMQCQRGKGQPETMQLFFARVCPVIHADNLAQGRSSWQSKLTAVQARFRERDVASFGDWSGGASSGRPIS